MIAATQVPSATVVGPSDRLHAPAKLIAVLDALVAEGVPADAALAGTGLTPQLLAASGAAVSLTDTLLVYTNAAKSSADPMFAYRVGKSLHVSAYGMYGFAILSSTDFRETMRFVTAYHQLATPLSTLRLDEGAGSACWTVAPVAHRLVDQRLIRFIVEMQFGLHLSLHRDVMGPSFAFDELRVGWSPPSDPDAYMTGLGCRVSFDQPAHAFLFASAWLNRPAPLGNRVALADMVALCDAALRERGQGLGVAGQVRHLLLVNLLQPMSFEEVARELRMSGRTLRRRLVAEGTNFRAELDGLRRDLALRHLQDKGRTVEEIAFALGFSDAANFRHAFRRWTNAAPRKRSSS